MECNAKAYSRSDNKRITESWLTAPSKIAWIHLIKRKRVRPIAVPLNDAACAALHRQVEKHLINVFTYRGNPIKQVNTKAWRKALVCAGVTNFRWHDLRHTWASWLVMEEGRLSELQELGGWQSSTLVQRYAHFSSGHLAHVSNRLNGVLG